MLHLQSPSGNEHVQVKSFRSGTLMEKKCRHCGESFVHKLGRKHKWFCSDRCQRRHHDGKPVISPTAWETDLPGYCCICSTLLPIPRNALQKYCGRQCSQRADDRRQRNRKVVVLREALRNRLWECLKKKGLQKANSITKYLGCPPSDLPSILEKKFLPGMTWDNRGRGGWDIDHIIPCASFDLSKQEHLSVCFHHLNLQPLWALDNSLKRNIHRTGIPDKLKEMAFRAGILVL